MKNLIILILGLMVLSTCSAKCEAHEDEDWRHIYETTHIVGREPCFAGELWYVTDPDDIGPIVECRFIRFIHGKQHAMSFPPMNGKCYCWMGGDI
jgi:hypothetical protein